MSKRPEFFVYTIKSSADMPRWLKLASSPGSEVVALAVLTGDKFSCMLVAPEMAAVLEPMLIDSFAVGRASKIVDQVRAVKEAIYMLRRPGVDDLIQAIEDEVDLAAVLRKAGE